MPVGLQWPNAQQSIVRFYSDGDERQEQRKGAAGGSLLNDCCDL